MTDVSADDKPVMMVPSWRLKEEAEKKRAAIARAEDCSGRAIKDSHADRRA